MKLDVISFGEILWDIFETKPRGREPIGREFRRELGGAPGNVATVLSRLGVKVALVGGVGKDRFGDALLAHLAKDGVDTRFVVRMPSRTGLTFVTRDARGEPSFLFYRHRSADVSLTAGDVKPAMGKARWALVGTSTLMTPSLAAATRRFLQVAQKQGARVVVDLNVREHLWPSRKVMQREIGKLAASAALIKASDQDLRALAGTSGLGWLAAHAPEASWIVTRGPKAASAYGVHGETLVRTSRARCVDATGAGDAFLAGALAVLLAAKAEPGSPSWEDRQVWEGALATGHLVARKAISAAGAVRGVVGLAAVRARISRYRPG